MVLNILINRSDATLQILKNGVVLDYEKFLYYHELSDLLISTVDKLLKRNNIDPIRLFGDNKAMRNTKAKSNGVNIKSLKGYKIQGNLGPRPSQARRAIGQDSTSYKIAQAFLAGLKY